MIVVLLLVKMQALRAARGANRFACLRKTVLDVEDAESQHRYGFSMNPQLREKPVKTKVCGDC